MDRQTIINEMFMYLVGIGKIQTQQDLANAVGANPATISGAMNGNERNLTLSLLKRINYAFGSIFNDYWIKTGEGRKLNTSKSPSLTLETRQSDTKHVSVDISGVETENGVTTIKLSIRIEQ